jgi:rhamnose utilization protein RhaD (predicted bifunctional aldolase and dehydrogenase)
MNPSSILSRLVALSQTLGRPDWDCVLLGEGNTSARVDAESFYVKASGAQLGSAGAEGYVRVAFAPVLELLGSERAGDEAVTAVLTAAALEPPGLRPSIETVMHAYLLSCKLTAGEPGINFVGHTHPTAINALTCSVRGKEIALGGRMTAEEITFCGPRTCWVEYTDPGLGLGRAVRDAVERYVEECSALPRMILVQNHGLIIPGRTAEEVETATQIAVKTARSLVGTMAFGGPNFLPQSEVDRICTRPDEALRLRKMGWKE